MLYYIKPISKETYFELFANINESDVSVTEKGWL